MVVGDRRRVKCGCIGDIIKVALCLACAFHLNYFRDFQEFSRRKRGSATGRIFARIYRKKCAVHIF